MPETLRGLIERIVFHNLDTGYCVLRVQSPDRDEPVTIVGYLPSASAGEQIEAVGQWDRHKSFGLQFKATSIVTALPSTRDGITRYLASGFVRGIGRKYAQKIVETFGDKTLDIMNTSLARLDEVKGISRRKIQKIREAWAEQRNVHEIMAFLMSHGIGRITAQKVFKTYGTATIETVRANPYRLIEDIHGIGFQTADAMAQALGLAPDSPQRANAAVRHVLKDAASASGHTALPQDVLIGETARLTGMNADQLYASIDRLAESKEVVIDDPAGQRLVYLSALFAAEVTVAERMHAILHGPHPLPVIDVDAALAWLEGRMSIALAASQFAAIRLWAASKVMVLTGGPGTGKTTIVRAILEIAAAGNLSIALATPTGRAAKRLAETTGREAKTIHRLLEYDPAAGGFQRGRGESRLELDLLVIDETSMVDVVLMAALLDAVPNQAAVLFVGDVDQLPSVGPGSVLRDFIESRAIPVARLHEVHRQAEASHIVRAAHAVNSGLEPISAPPGRGDFYFIEAEDTNVILDRILAMITERIPAKFGLDPLTDVQVLTPMNRTDLGVQALNELLQRTLNPPRSDREELVRFGTTFRVGDKVMQTRNNYLLDVFNGDIGRIMEIDSDDQVITVEYDGRAVLYENYDLDDLTLAYAATIHKSQGSEYPAVIVPVHTQHFIMLQRNLLYTAITRGRSLVVLVGMRKALMIAVQRAEKSFRHGLLRGRLAARDRGVL